MDSIHIILDIVKYMNIHCKGNNMKKKLIKSGNAWVLLLQKAIIELLDIDPENDEVELEIENKTLKVKKYVKQ